LLSLRLAGYRRTGLQGRDGDLRGGRECRLRYFIVTNRRCGKLQNMKVSVRWLLFEYKGLELVILSKPFKTKKLAEKARLKYPDHIARKIGIGVVRC
jgi:hypothetical protein